MLVSLVMLPLQCSVIPDSLLLPLTSLTLCVTAQVRKTRDITWNPVRTTEDGTIPVGQSQDIDRVPKKGVTLMIYYLR